MTALPATVEARSTTPPQHRIQLRSYSPFAGLPGSRAAGDRCPVARVAGRGVAGLPRAGTATRRLALTGTPVRSDTAAIPFVTCERDPEGVRRSSADYTYGYGDALLDGVVRPVIFLSYSG